MTLGFNVAGKYFLRIKVMTSSEYIISDILKQIYFILDTFMLQTYQSNNCTITVHLNTIRVKVKINL